MQALADIDLSGQVALVTGAARGIGAATVRLLRARGARVAVHCFRSQPVDAGDLLLRADLSLPGAANRLMAEVRAGFGKLDYLVNHAAFSPPPPAIPDPGAAAPFDPALFDQAMAMDVRVPLELALAAPGLAAIVNLGAPAVRRGEAAAAPFLLGKAAIPALTQYLARRLAPHTRVNAVLPGLIDNGEVTAVDPASDAWRQTVIHRTPMGRLGHPDEVAETVVYLLAGNSFITGQVLTIDGGWDL